MLWKNRNNTHLVLGLYSAFLLEDIKPLVQYQNETLLFSCCLQGQFNSVPGDGIFVLVPNFREWATFFVQRLFDANIDTIVLVSRSVFLGWYIPEAFTDKGGTVEKKLVYPLLKPDVASIAGAIKYAIDELYKKNKLDKVAVVIESFDEVAVILEHSYMLASDEAMDLDDVRWFGVATNSSGIIGNKNATEFAEKVRYTAIILDIDRSYSLYPEVRSAIMEDLNTTREPDMYSYIAYDTTQILGKAIQKANSSEVKDVIRQLPSVAENYNGFVGNARLNENGDLAQGNYQIWQVRDGEWQNVTSSVANFIRTSVLVSASLLAFFAAY